MLSIKQVAADKCNLSPPFWVKKDLCGLNTGVTSVKQQVLDTPPFGKWTSFNPKVHGFAFANSFTNTNRFEQIRIVMEGRCGGMAYAALDYFYNNISIPASSGLPTDGTCGGNYIYERLMASFHDVWQPLSHRILPSPTNWYGMGVKGGSNFEEIKREVDRNSPKPMVLVSLQSIIPGLVGDVGSCHQVCGIGYYEGNQNAEDIRVYIYDPNHPGKWAYLKPNLGDCLFEEWVVEDDGQERKVHSWKNYFANLKYSVYI